MALPAWQTWRSANPEAAVTVAAKPGVAPLWRLVPGVERIITLHGGRGGMRCAVRELRGVAATVAIVLPHTLRSGWLAWRAGVPRRRGTTWQWRRGLINEPVRLHDLAAAHQQYENFRLFDLALPAVPAAPQLVVTPESVAAVRERLALQTAERYVAILPGAARGSSKRWPAAHYAAAAMALAAVRPGIHFLLCGTPDEAEACRSVAQSLGVMATNLAGKTSLIELAALLSMTAAVVCNDSGGMHLAAATGVPVVAVFGLTDPHKTGPLGRAIVVAPAGVRGKRAIARDSAAATRVLASIAPERVFEALLEVIPE